MPLVNRVAVIDTESWSVVKNIDTGFRPGRLVLDGALLWVAHENERAADAALTVIDTRSLKAATTIATGRAPHQLVFSPDGNRAFVTNGADGTVSIIDTATQKKLTDVRHRSFSCRHRRIVARARPPMSSTATARSR